MKAKRLTLRIDESIEDLLSQVQDKSKFVRTAIRNEFHNKKVESDPRITDFLYVQNTGIPGIEFQNNYFLRFTSNSLLDFKHFLEFCKDHLKDEYEQKTAKKLYNLFATTYFDNFKIRK